MGSLSTFFWTLSADGPAAAAEQVDVPVQEVGERAAARADAEEHEAAGEHDREEGEDPLRVPAQAAEEELGLVVGAPSRSRLGAAYVLRSGGMPSSLSRASTPFSPQLVPIECSSLVAYLAVYQGSRDATRESRRARRRPPGPPRAGTASPRARRRRGRRACPARAIRSRSSRRSARAEPRVASSSASAAVSASGRRSRARAKKRAVRSSSNMSNDGADAGLSVPRPTVTPASSSSLSGATPQPRSAFDRGQCDDRDAVLGQERGLFLVDVDAMRARSADRSAVPARRVPIPRRANERGRPPRSGPRIPRRRSHSPRPRSPRGASRSGRPSPTHLPRARPTPCRARAARCRAARGRRARRLDPLAVGLEARVRVWIVGSPWLKTSM